MILNCSRNIKLSRSKGWKTKYSLLLRLPYLSSVSPSFHLYLYHVLRFNALYSRLPSYAFTDMFAFLIPSKQHPGDSLPYIISLSITLFR